MDIVGIVRILLGTIILFYASSCWLNQRFWSRKHFDWKPKEYWPEVFWFNIIGGTLGGIGLILWSLWQM
jgi:hypothetical protein